LFSPQNKNPVKWMSWMPAFAGATNFLVASLDGNSKNIFEEKFF
jgi:hypothetical protein